MKYEQLRRCGLNREQCARITVFDETDNLQSKCIRDRIEHFLGIIKEEQLLLVQCSEFEVIRKSKLRGEKVKSIGDLRLSYEAEYEIDKIRAGGIRCITPQPEDEL